MTPKDVLKMAKEKGARIIDLRFIEKVTKSHPQFFSDLKPVP